MSSLVDRHLGELEKEFDDDSETYLSVLKPKNNHLNLVKGNLWSSLLFLTYKIM